MLVLTRDVNGDSVILIGQDIKIRLLAADRGRARIGVEAPKGVPIWRSELVDGKPKVSVEPLGEAPR
jgi:carbon storage regulator